MNDFSIDVSPAERERRSREAGRYTVTLTPAGAFTGTVTLSVTGLRARDTVAYGPQPGRGLEHADRHRHDVDEGRSAEHFLYISLA